MIRKTIIATTLGAFALSTAACNTVKGLGEDIQSVGEAGEEVISAAPLTDQTERDAR